MVKKFTIPFASQGDANDIPDALQVDGKVSFTQGFGYDYERPYDDPQAKDIAREDMNGLFKAITSAVGELQTLGASEWSNAISYPKGAIVYHEKDLYISQIDDNQNKPPQNWVSITSIANDSLKKAANLSDLTNKATARNNLGLGSSATLNKTDILGTSTSLVATQKLVNDTKINLESSKQDKLTFVGDGPEVMRRGAFGLGGKIPNWNFDGWLNTDIKVIEEPYSPTGFYNMNGIGEYSYPSGIKISSASNFSYFLYMSESGKSGYVRATADGHKNYTFMLQEDLAQSTGSSTTNVMSQKAVTDQLNAIKSGHGLGYGQQWVDVTSQRVAGTTYTNNTGKPIFVSVELTDPGFGFAANILVDNVVVQNISFTGGFSGQESKSFSISCIIPVNSAYKIDDHGTKTNLKKWVELR